MNKLIGAKTKVMLILADIVTFIAKTLGSALVSKIESFCSAASNLGGSSFPGNILGAVCGTGAKIVTAPVRAVGAALAFLGNIAFPICIALTIIVFLLPIIIKLIKRIKQRRAAKKAQAVAAQAAAQAAPQQVTESFTRGCEDAKSFQ